MVTKTTNLLTDVVHEAAHPLVGDINDYDPLMQLVGDASLVLIGEASHGTQEFYRDTGPKRSVQVTIFAPD
jgi:erythromycin esterase-like protein